ncbi:papilin [Caerostris darwini]|uniref:Papilin n=1 Tax=Caerostris darwini TaxID=1538125 RepID=A0AAV4SW00_9ARAC|nr:papilin [Caerostris darwini]
MRTSIFFLCLTFLGTTFAEGEDVEKNCVDPPETGMCRAHFSRWNYDPKTGKCNEFVYGGCPGNGNRYDSEEECLDNCKGK